MPGSGIGAGPPGGYVAEMHSNGIEVEALTEVVLGAVEEAETPRVVWISGILRTRPVPVRLQIQEVTCVS